jgi:hypothetical protein
VKLTLKSVVEIHEQPSESFVGAPPGNIDMPKMVSDPIWFIPRIQGYPIGGQRKNLLSFNANLEASYSHRK